MSELAKRNLRHRAEGSMRLLRNYLLKEIADGTLAPADRLPTERELAARFKLARHTVRRILRELEAEGRIVRYVGRGTFVAEGYGAVERYKDLAIDVASPAQVMEVRLLLEPRIAWLAAVRGAAQDLDAVSEAVLRGYRAATWTEFEKWDDAFHMAIVASVRNDFLSKLYEAISEVRREASWGRLKEMSLTAERIQAYSAEHEAVANALKARDCEAASEAMAQHLRHVQTNMLG